MDKEDMNKNIDKKRKMIDKTIKYIIKKQAEIENGEITPYTGLPQEYWDVMAEPLYDDDKKSFLRRLFGL